MNKLTIRNALNKAFLKVKPNREAIDKFKNALNNLLQRIDPEESEEFNKNLLSDFFKEFAFQSEYFINTKGKTDLVIHQGKTAKTPVAVMIEAKKPNKKAEMPTTKNLNSKAMQELLLYYFRERITDNNLAVKQLIITDTLQWFVFDAAEFEKYFVNDKQLVKQFEAFEAGNLSGTKTDFFYNNIAKPAIDRIQKDIKFTHFNLNDYRKITAAEHSDKDKKLIPLFKMLSPEHLLKLKFANDSNTLDKRFYAELLHLIGLHEVGKSKKTIERLPKGKRNTGSFLENTIVQLESTNGLRRIQNRKQYGKTETEQLEAVALELVITWINRILFLKLLEAQLLSYHKGDSAYSFLSYDKLNEYAEVSALFFQVLAKKTTDRTAFNQQHFAKVPYLNSSLFEPTELEGHTIFINALQDRFNLKLLTTTVLKQDNGKRLTGELNTLEYLFAFLEAYDFTSEGSEDIQEQSKTIINASVLGLIFEKINGYKDGSFFTPGFITMYMCRETLRRTVMQKFNDVNNWNCQNFNELYNQIRDRKAANTLVNSLKICDPAVGSGHFLVSALNEMIAIKYDLGILQDENGKGFRDYRFEVENDELVVWDEQEDQLFQYNTKSVESKRIQKTLFHEKQTIIENCLFGVDINPNSVKICRLRLWIELLKNAYYKNKTELETLPNIDINIQCGNSLISRFDLDTDLKEVLKEAKKKHGITLKQYKNAFKRYRQTNNKDVKYEMAELIKKVKTAFRTSISKNSKENRQLAKLSEELYFKYNSTSLFKTRLTKQQKAHKATLTKKVDQLKTQIHEIEHNAIYENAFEWRFEFPEVLNNKGEFVGFDVVIGNPPYGYDYLQSFEKVHYKNQYSDVHQKMHEMSAYFTNRGEQILIKNGYLAFITPNNLIFQLTFEKFRNYIITNNKLINVINLGDNVFNEASIPTCIMIFRKSSLQSYTIKYIDLRQGNHIKLLNDVNGSDLLNTDILKLSGKVFGISKEVISILNKITKQALSIEEYLEKASYGVGSGGDKIFRIKQDTIDKYQIEKDLLKKVISGNNIQKYNINYTEDFLIYTVKKVDASSIKNTLNYLKPFKKKLSNKRETKKGTLPWWCLHWARNPDLFSTPKIILRQTSDKIIAALDNNTGYYTMDSVMIIKLKDSSLYLDMLGLLNSKLYDYVYKSITQEVGRTFAQVKPANIRKLPIPKDIKEGILKPLVTKILSQKKSDPNSDTSELESEIDQLVYALYDLTAEEISIIEKG